MFYLIGGAPRCGKTSLSKAISKKTGCPWISGDTMEGIVRQYVAAGDLDKLFPKNVMRRLTEGSNEKMYNSYSSEEIAKAYLEQGKTSHKAIEAFAASEIVTGHDYVIEGHQVHPDLADALIKKFGRENFRVLFLGKTDLDGLVRGFSLNIANDCWIKNKSASTDIYPKIAEMIAEYSRFFKFEAKKLGFDYLEIGCENFSEQLDDMAKNLVGA
ncbi:hypothetical protein GF376_02470 [Candidatus Peregrinibacteria bacterium]|nr:hypothetical protein [Candidatus Peregrinibacteria bacterium]